MGKHDDYPLPSQCHVCGGSMEENGLMAQAADRIEQIAGDLSSRTIALQHAIDLGQRLVYPSDDTINAWRKALGWDSVSESALESIRKCP